MSPYMVVLYRSARKDLERLDEPILTRVRERLAALAENPFPPGVKHLSNQSLYRIRVGDYRIVYYVQAEIRIVGIVRVGHRSVVYRTL
jgi:mRNA interferase RelE/StbE